MLDLPQGDLDEKAPWLFYCSPEVISLMVAPMPKVEESDLYLESWEKLALSDEVTDLRVDIDKTDFSFLEQRIASLDGQLKFNPLKK